MCSCGLSEEVKRRSSRKCQYSVILLCIRHDAFNHKCLTHALPSLVVFVISRSRTTRFEPRPDTEYMTFCLFSSAPADECWMVPCDRLWTVCALHMHSQSPLLSDSTLHLVSWQYADKSVIHRFVIKIFCTLSCIVDSELRTWKQEILMWLEWFSTTFVSINRKTCELFKGSAMLSITDILCAELLNECSADLLKK